MNNLIALYGFEISILFWVVIIFVIACIYAIGRNNVLNSK